MHYPERINCVAPGHRVQEVEVTSQVVTTMPSLDGRAGCCDHPAPPSPQGHEGPPSDVVGQLPTESDQLRNVYLHPHFMKEFLAYAQVRAFQHGLLAHPPAHLQSPNVNVISVAAADAGSAEQHTG